VSRLPSFSVLLPAPGSMHIRRRNDMLEKGSDQGHFQSHRMASPHIAGLAAYLLGTEWAAKAAKEEALALQAEAKTSTSFASALGQIAFGSRRSFVGKPEDHLLSPKALKKHMIEIGTPKVLTVSQDTSRLIPAVRNVTFCGLRLTVFCWPTGHWRWLAQHSLVQRLVRTQEGRRVVRPLQAEARRQVAFRRGRRVRGEDGVRARREASERTRGAPE
jgi:hypothetical protein